VTAVRIRIRLGGSDSELSRFFVGSLAAHFVIATTLILLPSMRPRKTFPDNPIVVDLVAASRPAAKVQQQAPAPPRETTRPEGVRVETREPPKAKPLPENPKPKPRKKEEKKPRPEPAAGATGPAPSTESDTLQAPEGTEGAGSSIAAAEVGDVRFSWYRDSVTAALYSQWRRPVLAGLGEPVEVRVTFEILRDGSVRSLRVEEASGVASFDRTALRAVSDAAPLPPLPANWDEPTLPATYVFRLFPD
jgi:protein TonB